MGRRSWLGAPNERDYGCDLTSIRFVCVLLWSVDYRSPIADRVAETPGSEFVTAVPRRFPVALMWSPLRATHERHEIQTCVSFRGYRVRRAWVMQGCANLAMFEKHIWIAMTSVSSNTLFSLRNSRLMQFSKALRLTSAECGSHISANSATQNDAELRKMTQNWIDLLDRGRLAWWGLQPARVGSTPVSNTP
jgi:hypothetical protein